MKLSEIAALSGKGGLFKVITTTKSGVVLESLDESKTKLVTSAHNRLSFLHEISIYTNTQEGTIPLHDVLRKIKSEFGEDLGIDGSSDSLELKSFLKSVVPDFDESRVYSSDIKKLIKWYHILLKQTPQIFEDDVEPEAEKEEK